MKAIMTLDKLDKIAKSLLEKAIKSKSKTATVIALHGELGAGKTTLTQEIARLLGIKENLISPTFVIMKKYAISKNKNFKYLIHIDAYRLNSGKELLNLGWQELFEDKDNLIIVEWPEKVLECLVGDICKVSLKHKDDKTRELEILV
ncbi:MAG TPA: tRNA (adenosine(37)-N6)-threonylcarbamoyltransferase complex ATPase subunit type 1 TsaE [Candidatus Paceibacterota bacterium]|nr:tRNA (adenosine(37)-N6)-threonylcarbamoyltransferase complex ATPase subunit type 1 TsaE [Candidatus Paceibacterota bacterium]